MTIRPLGAGALRLRNVCATAKLDCRLVPNQEIKPTRDLIRRHLDKHGYSDIEIIPMGGGDEWSQTSVKAPAVQSVVSVYKEYGVEPAIWPRSDHRRVTANLQPRRRA